MGWWEDFSNGGTYAKSLRRNGWKKSSPMPCLLSTSILGDRYHKFMTESRHKPVSWQSVPTTGWIFRLEWQSEHLKPRVTSVHDEIPLGKLNYLTVLVNDQFEVMCTQVVSPPDSHQNLQCHFISCTCYIRVILRIDVASLLSGYSKVTKHTCSFSECPFIGFPSVHQDTSMLLSSHFLNNHYLAPSSFMKVECVIPNALERGNF